MEKKYLGEISKCINNPFLMESLAFGDYDDAKQIVNCWFFT